MQHGVNGTGNLQRCLDVVTHQLKARIAEMMRDVVDAPGREVVDSDDSQPEAHQSVDQMAADETCSPGDQHSFNHLELFTPQWQRMCRWPCGFSL